MLQFVDATMNLAAIRTNATALRAGGRPQPPARADVDTTHPVPDSRHETDPVRYREGRTTPTAVQRWRPTRQTVASCDKAKTAGPLDQMRSATMARADSTAQAIPTQETPRTMVFSRLAWEMVRKMLLTADGKLMPKHTYQSKVNRTSSRNPSCAGNAEGPQRQRGSRRCTEHQEQHLSGHPTASFSIALQK